MLKIQSHIYYWINNYNFNNDIKKGKLKEINNNTVYLINWKLICITSHEYKFANIMQYYYGLLNFWKKKCIDTVTIINILN